MNVSLTPELEKVVKDKVESGLYNSASEVVRESLRLLSEQDMLRQMKLENLKKELQIGFDQIERGEVVPLEKAIAELEEKSKAMRKSLSK